MVKPFNGPWHPGNKRFWPFPLCPQTNQHLCGWVQGESQHKTLSLGSRTDGEGGLLRGSHEHKTVYNSPASQPSQTRVEVLHAVSHFPLFVASNPPLHPWGTRNNKEFLMVQVKGRRAAKGASGFQTFGLPAPKTLNRNDCLARREGRRPSSLLSALSGREGEGTLKGFAQAWCLSIMSAVPGIMGKLACREDSRVGFFFFLLQKLLLT